MHRTSRRTASVIAIVAGLSLCGEATAADTEVVSLDRDLVRLNTSNPPGNEVQVANYMRIVLVFEADEEGGDYGIEWLAENQWDKLDAAYSINEPPTPSTRNEGGIISTDSSGRPRLAAVTVRDKISLSVVCARAVCRATPRDRNRRARSTAWRAR